MTNNKRINNQIVIHPLNGAMDGIHDSLKLVSMESFNNFRNISEFINFKKT